MIRYESRGERPSLEVDRTFLSVPEPGGWTYAHHPHLAWWGGRWHAMWSNGRVHEDDTGQRVLWATSTDFAEWGAPLPLFPTRRGKHSEVVLTAAGFHATAAHLVAYSGQYEYRPEVLENGARRPGDQGHQDTGLRARVSTDGQAWGDEIDLQVPLVPNYGPQATRSGRLIISGNVMFPYSDAADGLRGWTPTGIYPADMRDVYDDSEGFWKVREHQGWDLGLCEGSFYQTDDGVLHMLLRSGSENLWVTESRDDGATWSAPTPTDFTDNVTKFQFGRLADGRFFYVGCPDPEPRYARSPLVLALSEDGVTFDRSWVLADDSTPYAQRAEGLHKGGDYGYPHVVERDGALHVIVSRRKEAVEVLRARVAGL